MRLAAYHRVRNLKRYGLTPEQYDVLFLKQKGVCAICSRPSKSKRLSVDHNHQTGQRRGLLCQKCNGALGWYEEFDGEIVEYLLFTQGLDV